MTSGEFLTDSSSSFKLLEIGWLVEGGGGVTLCLMDSSSETRLQTETLQLSW